MTSRGDVRRRTSRVRSRRAPDFPLLCERMLMRRPGDRRDIHGLRPLSIDGEDLTRAPYSERRTQLHALNLKGVHWQTPETFDDGEALFNAVCAHELEGVVAKRRTSQYRPAERGWVKIKNREYWRWGMERESALNKPRQRMVRLMLPRDFLEPSLRRGRCPRRRFPTSSAGQPGATVPSRLA
jgi:ATP dependent DNA ligase domain